MSENLCLTGQRANIVSQNTCVGKPVSENLCLTVPRANIVSQKTCVGKPVPYWSEG